jgi:hypothetical protein
MAEKKFASKPLDAKAERAPKPADKVRPEERKPDIRDEDLLVKELKKVKAEDLVEAIFQFEGRKGLRLLQSALVEVARRKAVNESVSASQKAGLEEAKTR